MGQFTTSARWSPTADLIVYDRQTTGPFHDLVLTRPDGAGSRLLNTVSADAGSCCAQWSPDGRFLVFERALDDSHVGLFTIAISGTGQARRVTGETGPYLTFTWIE